LLPWCRLEREYTAGPVALTPFKRATPPATFDAETTHVVSTILDSFIGVTGDPMDRCTVVTLHGQVLMEGYTPPTAFETIFDHIQMACLSSLEQREFCGPSEPYSNSECFALFTRHFGPGGVGAPPFLRRDGSPTFRASGGLRVHMPVQVAAVSRPPLNERLWSALAKLRRQWLEDGRSGDWARWAESIYSFNLANTDREDGSAHMDWVLMSSAIERLAEARSRADDVAAKVAGTVLPSSSDSRNGTIVREWAREFYRLRNDYAHGKLRSGQVRSWNAPSHLVLAAIIFPILVKSLLAREGCYKPTDEDCSEAIAFAGFADDLRNPESHLKTWRTYIRDQRTKPN
jgi:hypothetical protein